MAQTCKETFFVKSAALKSICIDNQHVINLFQPVKNEKKPVKTKYEDVTEADVKACKGYESISDEEAQQIADAIRVYTEIIYNCFKDRKFEGGEAKVISLSSNKNKRAA